MNDVKLLSVLLILLGGLIILLSFVGLWLGSWIALGWNAVGVFFVYDGYEKYKYSKRFDK